MLEEVNLKVSQIEAKLWMDTNSQHKFIHLWCVLSNSTSDHDSQICVVLDVTNQLKSPLLFLCHLELLFFFHWVFQWSPGFFFLMTWVRNCLFLHHSATSSRTSSILFFWSYRVLTVYFFLKSHLFCLPNFFFHLFQWLH